MTGPPANGLWKQTTLGDQITFQRGFDITKAQQRPGVYSVISSSGPGSTHDEFRVQGPGVVIGRKGSLGTVFYVDEPFWPHDTTLWVRDFHGNDPRFAYYFLQTLRLERYDSGASNPTLNRNHIHGLPILFPDLPAQEQIAAILTAYDELIQNNTRRIAILEEMARSLYREWFVDFRFPGHEQAVLTESELGLIPEGWNVDELRAVADVNPESLSRGHGLQEINYVDISSVSPGQITKIETMLFENAPGRARRVVRSGDTIWSTVRPNRRSYSIVLNPPDALIVSTGFAVIRPRAVPYSYLYHAVTTDRFADYLTNHATGSAYPAVSAADFENARILIPPADLLDGYQATTGDMLELRQRLLKKNRILGSTRDFLLPKLISGEIEPTACTAPSD